VKRADKQLSGRRDARIEVSVGAVEGSAFSAFSFAEAEGFEGTGTENSEMIWSASFRRSEDRSGDKFLICGLQKSDHSFLASGKTCLGLLLEHVV
jgi:hypothetical protein